MVEISHCYRETTRCADALANMKCHLEHSLTIFADCQSQMREIFYSDNTRITIPRLIVL